MTAPFAHRRSVQIAIFSVLPAFFVSPQPLNHPNRVTLSCKSVCSISCIRMPRTFRMQRALMFYPVRRSRVCKYRFLARSGIRFGAK
jgi:hypothetical protein